MSQLAVLGAGAWGTALANLLARNGCRADLWAQDAAHVADMRRERENRRRLPGVALLAGVEPVAEVPVFAPGAVVLAAVPAQALRATLQRLANACEGALVICAKGIERGSGLFVSQVAAQILPGWPVAVLSGPSFAHDLAQGLPTAVTLGCADAALAAQITAALGAPWFRLYHSPDVRGVELGGAAKNVMAIACGIAAGRGLGASAGAALVARGFAELARFGRPLGAQPETLMGLSGLGDLVLTCNSPQSRNFAFGHALGAGGAAPGGGVAEGTFTAGILAQMARERGVDMPIVAAVDAVLAGRVDVGQAIEALLLRPARGEAG